MFWTLIRGGIALAANIGTTVAVVDYLRKKDPKRVESAGRGADELAKNVTELFQATLEGLNNQLDPEERCSEYDDHKHKK